MTSKIKCRVKAGARENKIEKIGEKDFRISVKEPAKEGRANKAIIELLAKYFDIPQSQIRIITGLKRKNKVIKIA